MSTKTKRKSINRIGVARVPLAKVRDEHLPGIYGDFREIVEAHIANSNGKEFAAVESRRFFEYLLENVDAKKYREIQRHYLDPKIVNPNADIVKYLDPTTWFESKLRLCYILGLDKKPPMRILDLGTGPGHFPFVAHFYGHSVLGTDLPARTRGAGHIYDALCDLYRVERIGLEIKPNTPLEGIPGRYDMVTAFLAAFNVYGGRTPWTIDHWRVFLRNLKLDILNDGGMLFMTLTNGKLTKESWGYLQSIADWTVEKSKQIHISKFED
jgi:hypothetical protein